MFDRIIRNFFWTNGTNGLIQLESIGNPAGIGQGTGFGLRERDRDGIGLGHYRLRATCGFSPQKLPKML